MVSTLDRSLARFGRHAGWGVCHTGRYRCRYFAWGAGPPVVMIHGLADRAASFAPLVDHLSSSFRCVAYELPNGLDDDARIGRYTHADHVADLHALLDHLGLERAAVFGSSFGSTVALAALRAAPDRLTQGVLQGGFARRPLTRLERALARSARYWPGRMGALPGRPWVMARVDQPAFAAAEPDAYPYFLRCSGHTPIRAAALRALILNRLDLRPTLSSVRQPVLMVGGDRDAIVPRFCEGEVENGLPDVRRVEIARCGHYPQYTHPAVVADAVRTFLRPAAGKDP